MEVFSVHPPTFVVVELIFVPSILLALDDVLVSVEPSREP
jgi:hypothetical protein